MNLQELQDFQGFKGPPPNILFTNSSNVIDVRNFTLEELNNTNMEDLQRKHNEQMALLSDEDRQRREKEIEFAKKGIIKSVNEKLAIIRAKRDELLAKSDYMFLVPDVVIDDKIIKYRQELRDFPNKIVNGIYDKRVHILAITNDDLISSYFPKI